jgi:hypothetical protein
MLYDRSTVSNYLFRRVSKRLFKQFNCTKEELSFLLKLAGFSSLLDREIVPFIKFKALHSASLHDKKKLDQYYFHCQRKKFVGSYEYILIPGSKCVGLSILGKAIILEYFKQVKLLAATLKPKNKNNIQRLPARFRLVA